MEVNATGNSTSPPSLDGALGEAGELGRDEFLKLLVTKLANQDPLNPTEDTEFIEQLASFSSLEQLIQVNESINALTAGQAELVNSQALNLIGKEAVLPITDAIEVEGGVPVDDVIYAVPESVKEAKLHLRDAEGNIVASYELDPIAGGRRVVDWEAAAGDQKSLADGTYTIDFEATPIGDRPAELLLYQSLAIDGVNLQEGGMQLISRGRVIPYESILEIRTDS